MSSSVQAATIDPALSLAQHKSALWADDSLQVYAVMMGTRIPDLATTLASADVTDFDCLLPGALSAQAQRDAPYLVQLKPASVFTDWLLFEAAPSLGEWGVLARSASKLTPLRGHMRGLLAAQTPAGQRVALDWMDPTILLALLPLFESVELTNFMGPMQSLVIVQAATWTRADFVHGKLQRRAVPVAKSA